MTDMTEEQAAPAGLDQGPPHGDIQTLLDQLDLGRAGPGCNLIGVLQDVQDCFGYLPPSALGEISRRTRIPLSRIYGVVSFYAQFHTEPRGRHTIRCCRGTACYVRGGKQVIQAIEQALGVEDGQTTEDMMFSFETVACLGACALAPVMVVDDTYCGKVEAQQVEKLLKQHLPQPAGAEETA